jgi:Predicted permease
MTSPEPPPDPHPPAEANDPGPRAATVGQQPAPPSDGSDFIPLSTPPRDSRDAVIWPVRVAAAWSWRLLVVAAGLYVVILLFSKIHIVAFAFIVALFFTAVLNPVDKWLESLGLHKSAAASLVLLAGIVVVGLIGWFVVVQITSHANTLGDQLTKGSEQIRDRLQNGPFHLREADLNNFTNSITDAIKNNQGKLVSGAVCHRADGFRGAWRSGAVDLLDLLPVA